MNNYKSDSDERKSIFVASCVESMARAVGVTPGEMFGRMSKVRLVEEYILPCYDVLHSESRKNLTDDLLDTLALWEKKKQQ